MEHNTFGVLNADGYAECNQIKTNNKFSFYYTKLIYFTQLAIFEVTVPALWRTSRIFRQHFTDKYSFIAQL